MSSAAARDKALVDKVAYGLVEGGKVNTEALMLFYAEMGNREWKSVINSNPTGEINLDDFAHAEFCSAVIRSILVKQLEYNLINGGLPDRYRAGILLYDHWRIEKSFPATRN